MAFPLLGPKETSRGDSVPSRENTNNLPCNAVRTSICVNHSIVGIQSGNNFERSNQTCKSQQLSTTKELSNTVSLKNSNGMQTTNSVKSSAKTPLSASGLLA